MRRFRLFLGQYSYVVKYDKWLTHIHTFQSDSELWSELSFYTFLIFLCPKFAKARHERELNGGGDGFDVHCKKKNLMTLFMDAIT